MQTIDELKAIVARLRGPGGCPWDQEQTHQSIRSQLLEECYEVLEAIDEGNDSLLEEELGDVLLHIVFHAQLAEEEGKFSLDDVARGINEKLIRRHPHVFGEGGKLGSAAEVLQKWDELKKVEKPERTGALHGIPPILPALMLAQETQKKAAKAGFDWKEVRPVLDKLKEEIAELEKDLEHPQRAADELGDVFFSLVNLARHLKVDAEQSCRDATRKFTRRFEHAEAEAARQGRALKDRSPEELDRLWETAKEAAQKAT
ncbi:MAG: nucleoside triphosphate pyrophosphohydrolase [Candidatus Methylacidiphilales bacterium]|nr:nucleoside triphosphate pyrophosphohydrolase [Candidatus Methylacidiphilales bacterium]